MGKLPKLYKNNITKNIRNNKEIERIKNISSISATSDKFDVLNKIFKGRGFPYTKDVIITTNDKVYDTSLISKYDSYVLTIDNDKILISDIINIQIKNPRE